MRRVQNLVVQLDLILKALLAPVEGLYALLLVPVDGNFGFLRLEGPALLIVYQLL